VHGECAGGLGMGGETCVLTCARHVERRPRYPGGEDTANVSWENGECGILDQDFGAVVAGKLCRNIGPC